MKVKGKVRRVVLRGEVAYIDGQVSSSLHYPMAVEQQEAIDALCGSVSLHSSVQPDGFPLTDVNTYRHRVGMSSNHLPLMFGVCE